MPRKPSFKRKKTEPDAKFKSKLAAKFINRMMLCGKKSLSERLFYGALDIIAEKVTEDEPFEVFKKAVKNTSPVVKVKARRIGGSTYQVPMEVKPSVSEAMSHRWIIGAARKRGGKTFVDKLANELMDAYQNKGGAVAKKEETHRMADANKAFAHYGRF